MNKLSFGGAEYFVTFFDEASAFTTSVHMKTNGQAAAILKEYVTWVERQTEMLVKKSAADYEKEYVKWLQDLKTKIIGISVTAEHTTQENERAERMKRTNRNAIRTLLLTSRAPTHMCAECLYIAYDAHKFLGCSQQGKTLEELSILLKPSVAHLRTFRCYAWV